MEDAEPDLLPGKRLSVWMPLILIRPLRTDMPVSLAHSVRYMVKRSFHFMAIHIKANRVKVDGFRAELSKSVQRPFYL